MFSFYRSVHANLNHKSNDYYDNTASNIDHFVIYQDNYHNDR